MAAKTDSFIATIILIAGLKFTFGLENVLDIGLYDESNYLYRGLRIASVGFPRAELAPLYSLWYSFIQLLESDRISLYYLNYKLMTILPPIIAFILLRRNRVSAPSSLVVSLLLLFFNANANTWPKVSHFALILILVMLVTISYTKSFLGAVLLSLIGTLLLSYIRPEYFLTYLLFLLVYIYIFIRTDRKLRRRSLIGLVICGLLSAVFFGILGMPVSGNRSLFAFGQHFSLNWTIWSRSDLNPWTNWQVIVSQNFGPVNSIPEAIVNNPVIFLKHVTYNFYNFIGASAKLFSPALLLKERSIQEMSIQLLIRALLLFSVFLAVYYLSKDQPRRSSSQPRQAKQDFDLQSVITRSLASLRSGRALKAMQTRGCEHRRLLVCVGLLLIPTVVSVIVIYPRDHYLLLLYVLAIVSMTILGGSRTLEPKPVSYRRLFLIGVLIVILTPRYIGQASAARPNLDTIRFIQSLDIRESVNLLESEGGYHIYLGDNFRRVAEFDKEVNFNRFLVDRNINMIVISDYLLQEPRFNGDAEWQNFLLDYPRLGFIQLDVPNTDRQVIVQANLLHK